MKTVTGRCPVKGHPIEVNIITGKPFGMLRAVSSAERPRPFGRGASIGAGFRRNE
jgi:hypothetical protein